MPRLLLVAATCCALSVDCELVAAGEDGPRIAMSFRPPGGCGVRVWGRGGNPLHTLTAHGGAVPVWHGVCGRVREKREAPERSHKSFIKAVSTISRHAQKEMTRTQS